MSGIILPIVVLFCLMIFYALPGDKEKEGGAINTLKNRSDIEVMASILRAAISNWEYKTTIMNTAVVSHSQLIRYLAIAVEKGLIEYSETTGLYKTTEAGVKYLSKYEQLLVLLPAIPDLPDLDSVTDSTTQSQLNEPIKDRLFL
jgi:predicted transcriptional regulator